MENNPACKFYHKLIHRHLLGDELPYAQLPILAKIGRVVVCSVQQYFKHKQNLQAITLTYYTFFAIVPITALALGIAKGFSMEELLRNQLTQKLANHQAVVDWVCQFAENTLDQAQGGLVTGVGAVTLIAIVIWLATCIAQAFHAVWNLPVGKNVFRRFSDCLAVILVTPIFLVVMSSAGMFIQTALRQFLSSSPGLESMGEETFTILIKVFPLFLSILLLTLIYWRVPDTKVKLIPALLSAIVAGMLFQLLQNIFIYLQSWLYRYNNVYGSFAVLPLFLIWLQVSWHIILYGAEICYVIQNAPAGIFDQSNDGSLSYKLRRQYQLALSKIVYLNFEHGKGATPIQELCQAIPLQMIQLQPLLDELQEARVLLKSELDGVYSYLPGYPTDRFTICDVLAQLEQTGINLPIPEASSALEGIPTQLDQIQHDASTSSNNLKLKEL